MKRLVLLCSLPLAGLLAANSCALSGFVRGEGTGTTGGQGGVGVTGGSGGSGGSGGTMCSHASFPEPPAVMNAGGSLTLTMAVRSVDVGEENELVGIDLDRFCTCQGEGASCIGIMEMCDLPEGRDNAMRELFNAIGPLFSGETPSEFYSAKAEAGEWTVLLVVSDYNGETNDDQVRFEWYVSTGLDDPNTSAMPMWDGSDAWEISDASYLEDSGGQPDPTQPRFVDDNAYVSGGELVANLGDSKPELIFSGSNSYFRLRLTGATLNARLEEGPNGWSASEGLIAGRIAERDVFDAISTFREGGFFICTDNQVPPYQAAKATICNARDIQASFGNFNDPCDALSFGFGFTADPAQLGSTVSSSEPVQLCTTGNDPADDSCDSGAGGAGGAGGGTQ